jgi:YbbR domain-containing protein
MRLRSFQLALRRFGLDFRNPFASRGSGRWRVSEAGLRLLAVGLAVGLWLFVNAGERGSVDEFTVPISYRTLPPGMEILNHPPDFVKIEVSGTRTLLSLLDEERLALKLDLNGVSTGQSDLKIYPSMFNVPRGTTVTRNSPDQLTLDVDRVVSHEVPVHLTVEGKVAQGFTMSSVEIKPSAVMARGPSRFVSNLNHVDTEPLDVRGLTSRIEHTIQIAPPNADVGLSAARVQVKVEVAEVIADREFRGVQVQVRDPDYKYRVEPKQVTVTIRGPAAKLAGLNGKNMAFIDASGMEPGGYDLPLQVTVPSGMQLVREAPDKVRLRLYRERRTISADEHPS